MDDWLAARLRGASQQGGVMDIVNFRKPIEKNEREKAIGLKGKSRIKAWYIIGNHNKAISRPKVGIPVKGGIWAWHIIGNHNKAVSRPNAARRLAVKRRTRTDYIVGNHNKAVAR